MGADTAHRSQSLSDGLMILFILASFNFLFGKLEGFSCETKALFAQSTWIRHAFALAGLFAVLVIFTRSNPVLEPRLLVIAAFGLYAVFLAICRCDARFLAFVLAAVVAIFYIEAEKAWSRKHGEKEDENGNGNATTLARTQTALGISALVAVAIGCVIYIGQHAREYKGSKWSWTTFWLGVPACKGNDSPCDRRNGCSMSGDFAGGLLKIFLLRP